MSSVQTPSLIYQYIKNTQYADALSTLDTFEKHDLNDIYKNYAEGKNCIHLIMDQPASSISEKLLDEIIKITEKFNKIDKFQQSEPFQYALGSIHKGHFDYLLKNRVNLLEDTAVSKCLHLIVKKNHTDKCQVFLKNLDEKHLHWISDPIRKTTSSPLVKAIEENRIRIFEIFINHLTRIKQGENKETTIFKPQQDGNTVLHSISKSPYGATFFQKLLQAKVLSTSSKEESEETLYSEVLGHLDVQNGQDKTPIFIASEEGNEKMVQKLIEYGADFSLPSDKEWEEDSNALIKKTSLQKKTPKEIGKTLKTKQLLEEAEYGLIEAAKGIPYNIVQTIENRKKEGLKKCCRDGKLENAKELIKNHNLDAFIKDGNDNSLPMIMLNYNILENTIIQFIDFLASEKKIDFDHLNSDEDNILTLSLTKNKEDVALHLIKKYNKNLNFNHENKLGMRALTLAAIDQFNVVEALSKFPEKVDLNLKKQGWKAIESILKRNEKLEQKPMPGGKIVFEFK